MKWTVGTLVKRASEILKERGIKTARLDAELLLAHALGFPDRVKLYTEFEKPLTEEEVENYRKLIVRRAKGEPVAYITGKKEFYGYTFRVEKGVLIPRPETELLVDVVVEYLKGKEGKTVVDVGTGSGCIIITLCKLLGRTHRYIGTDISSIALKVADKNRRIHGCKDVKLVKTDLLKSIEPPVSVVVSNPPYVPLGDRKLEESVKKFEPAVALFGGKDGLEVIRRLIPQSYEKLETGGLIALEVGEGQAEAVKELLELCGFKGIKFHKDISGIDRVVSAVK
ncbi:MAG: peptide chain release factor N(5)-glutamine methyltransferase [Desulfurobacterium sp.]|nr:MAG: peptide chain release factor N(5)-glutamine methyltransferase [Desulfurobacterium sp.]